MRKGLIIVVTLVAGLLVYLYHSFYSPFYSEQKENVCPEEIEKLRKEEKYSCCIEPACTECFELVGSCNCDKIVSEGRTPCAECAKALSCEYKTE